MIHKFINKSALPGHIEFKDLNVGQMFKIVDHPQDDSRIYMRISNYGLDTVHNHNAINLETGRTFRYEYWYRYFLVYPVFGTLEYSCD